MQYLLNSNIISALIRDPKGPVTTRIAGVGERNIFTSIVVSSEIKFGVKRNGSHALRSRVQNVLNRMFTADLSVPSDTRYADIRASLENMGTPVPPNDYFVAAHAVATDSVLVSADEHFKRIDGLKLENWLH